MHALYYPKADARAQRFPAVESQRPGIHPNVLLLHTTEGNGWPTYQGGGSAPHLTYRAATREWRQHFEFDVAAMALADAPGGVATNRLNVIQVEIADVTSGWASPENPRRPYTIARKAADLTEDNLRDLADLWRFLNAEWDVPFTITSRGFQPWNARQRPTMTADEWNQFKGMCGHQHVPENDHTDPGAINAGRILDLARGATAPATPQEKPMWTLREGDRDPKIRDMCQLLNDRGFTRFGSNYVGEGFDATNRQNLADFQTVILGWTGDQAADEPHQRAGTPHGVLTPWVLDRLRVVLRLGVRWYLDGNPVDVRAAKYAFIKAGVALPHMFDNPGWWNGTREGQIGIWLRECEIEWQKKIGNPIDPPLGPQEWATLGSSTGVFESADGVQPKAATMRQESGKVASPVPGAGISAVYGQRPKNRTYWQAKGYHTGRDYAANEGAPILAVVDGTVTVRDDGVLGCLAILRGDNGRYYWYAHCRRGSRETGRVKAGQKIAEVGQTGSGANGPHLHLEDASSGNTWGVGLRDPQW